MQITILFFTLAASLFIAIKALPAAVNHEDIEGKTRVEVEVQTDVPAEDLKDLDPDGEDGRYDNFDDDGDYNDVYHDDSGFYDDDDDGVYNEDSGFYEDDDDDDDDDSMIDNLREREQFQQENLEDR